MLLVLFLLVASVPATAITAFADTPVEDVAAAVTAEDYPTITPFEWETVEVTEDQPCGYFYFTPESDGTYVYYSVSDADTVGSILDAERDEIAYNDDGGEGFNFRIECNLEAGTTYILEAHFYGYGSGTFDVIIFNVDEMPSATAVNIIPEGDLIIYAGCDYEVEVEFEPDICVEEGYTWESSDPAIADVDEYGRIYAVCAGTAEITVTTGNGLTDSICVTVLAPIEMQLDETLTETLSGNADNKAFSFAPAEDGRYIIHVNSNDMVQTLIYDENEEYLNGYTGYGCSLSADMLAGESYKILTYLHNEVEESAEDIEFTISIEKLPRITSVEIDMEGTSCGYVGEYRDLYANYLPENAAEEEITWESSDPEIVEITYDGYDWAQINFVSPGTATITATFENGLTDSITFTVLEPVEIQLDETVTETFTGPHYGKGFFFAPQEDGEYIVTVNCEHYTISKVIGLEDRWVSSSSNRGEHTIRRDLYAGESCLITVYLLEEDGEYPEDAEFSFTVEKVPEATSIEIELNGASSGYIGEYRDLHVNYLPENAISEGITWESSDPEIVEIEYDGYDWAGIYFVSPGTATITATSENGLTDSITFTVLEPAEIQLDEEVVVSTDVDGGKALFCFVPEVTGTYVFYSYDNNFDTYGHLYDAQMYQLASNDDGGEGSNFKVVYELTAGETYYFKSRPLSENGATGVYAVQVNLLPAATSIEIEVDGAASGYAGEYRELNLNYLPENAAEEEITWESSDPEIVEITWNGNYEAGVYLVSPGTATITATSENGLTDSITITVLESVEIQLDETVIETFTSPHYSKGFSFTPEEDAVYRVVVESGHRLEATLMRLEDGSSYSSTGTGKHTISEDLYAGESYQITVYLLDKDGEYPEDAEFSITIEKVPAATSIEINADGASSGYAGEYRYLYVNYLPEGALIERITWESSDPEIVEITWNGNYEAEIYFVSPGTATITATSENGLVATCTLTVKDIDTIELGEEKVVTLDGEYAAYYSFTPDEDGYYSFCSYDNDHDTYGYILDANMEELARNDDGGDNNNFDVRYELEAGVTYILKARFYDTDDTGSFSVCVERAKMVTGLEIISMPERTEYIEGMVRDYLNYQGLQLRATWSDGSTTDWTYGNGWYIDNEHIALDTSDVEETGEIVLTCGKVIAILTLTVVENPVDHLEIASGTAKKYLENIDGYFNSNEDGKYFLYYADTPYDAVIRIVYKDGTTETANVGDEVGEYYIDCYTSQHNEPWVVGTENKMFITYLGHTVVLPITVVENPVDHLEIVSGTADKYMENIDGHFEWEEDGEYFSYATHTPHDAVIRIVYKDGTTETANVGEYVGDYYVGYYTEQHNEHWVVGTENKMYIEYLGHTVVLPITVVENPVDHIELVSGTAKKYIENLGGDFDENEDGEFFHYDTYTPSDVVIKIEYKDGTTETANVGDEVGEYYIESYTRQYDEPWVVGTENKMFIEYLGHTVELPITVIENPVDHLEIVSGTADKYMENIDGYWDENEDGEYFHYYTSTPYDAVIKIVYKDGTTETANMGDKIGDYYVGGYIESYSSQYDEPWVVGTENKMFIEYLGHTVVLPITVVENPVDHIELVSGTADKYMENSDGEFMWNEDGERFFYYNTHSHIDAVIKIVYKDGTTETANVGDEIGDYYIEYYTNQYDEPWVVGTENKMFIRYLGHTVALPITVVENPVDHIELVSGTAQKYIENIDGEFMWNKDGERFFYYNMLSHNDVVIKIVYKDGTTETTNVGEYYTVFSSNQYDEPWVVGTDNKMFINCLGHTVVLPITVVENPVELIEINSAPTREYLYGDKEYGYLYANGDYEFYPTDLTGLSFTVYYTDGTSKLFTDEDIEEDQMIDGYRYRLEYDWRNPEIGDFPVTFAYMGMRFEYTVKLLNHEHTYDSGVVTKAATCKEAGVKTYTCSVCSETKTEAIAKLTTHTYDHACDTTCNVCDETRTTTHSWDNGVVTKAATCKEAGVKTYTCSVCSETKTEAIAKLTTHTYDHACDTTCNVCDETRTTTHSWSGGVVTKAATCKEAGVMTYTCGICSETKTETIAKLTTHTYDHACDTTCNVCDETRTITHSWSGGVVTKAATCKEAGVMTYTCGICSETKTEAIAKLTTHTYDHACDTTCNVCDETRTTTHSWDNGVVTKAATCKEAGVKTFTCGICSETKTEAIAKLTTHTYTTTTTKATLSSDGSIVRACTVCGKVASTTAIARPTTFTLSTVNYTYNGAVKTPGVTVKDANGKTLVKGTDYTVTYPSGRTALGTYTVTITMKGNYSGTKILTFNIKLGTPTVTVANAANGVKVSWNKIAGATSYKVYRSVYTNGAWSSWTAIKIGVTGTTYTDTSLKSNANVKYTVRAFNGSHSSTYKASASIKFLAAPTVKVANAANGVKITWNKIAGTKTYTVYRSVYTNGAWSGWKAIKTGVTGTTYTDTSVKSNANVKYTVRAFNGNFSSSYKSSSSIKFLATPTVKATNAAKGVTVTWNKIAGAKTYTVYRSVYSGGKWSGWTAIKTGVTGTSYTDTTVKSGATVRYTVKAINGSFNSNVKASNTTKFLAQPAVKVAKATNGIKATWGKITGATGYIVYRRTYTNGKWSGWQQVKITTGLSFTDTTAKKGVTYQYTVRAYSGSYKSTYTNSSSIKR